MFGGHLGGAALRPRPLAAGVRDGEAAAFGGYVHTVPLAALVPTC